MFQAVGVSVVAEAASEEAIEVDEAVVGVVAEAEEVTLMVKAARKLKNNQNLNFRSKKNHFHENFRVIDFTKKTRNIKNAWWKQNQLSLKRPPSRYEKKYSVLKKNDQDGRRRKKSQNKFS